MPAKVLGEFIQAYDSGIINKRGFVECLEEWFSSLKGVGIIDSKPMGLWETTI